MVEPRHLVVIGARHDTMDPEHMEMMASKVQRGRYLYCPNGSHLANYDDQQVYMSGLVKFIRARSVCTAARPSSRNVGLKPMVSGSPVKVASIASLARASSVGVTVALRLDAGRSAAGVHWEEAHAWACAVADGPAALERPVVIVVMLVLFVVQRRAASVAANPSRPR